MACRGCEKQAERDAQMRREIEEAQAKRKVEEAQKKGKLMSTNRLAITCNCGLTRMLPAGLKEGDEFTLVPCPKCNSSLKGRLTAEGVQEVLS